MRDELYPVMTPSLWGAWRSVHGPSHLDVRKDPGFTSADLILRAAEQSQGGALARHQLAAEDVSSGLWIRPFGELSVELEGAYWIELSAHRFPTRAKLGVVDWMKRDAWPGAGERVAARGDGSTRTAATRLPRLRGRCKVRGRFRE